MTFISTVWFVYTEIYPWVLLFVFTSYISRAVNRNWSDVSYSKLKAGMFLIRELHVIIHVSQNSLTNCRNCLICKVCINAVLKIGPYALLCLPSLCLLVSNQTCVHLHCFGCRWLSMTLLKVLPLSFKKSLYI